ncbi:hypothetical protein KY315_03890, partial [Candidatus Woesearchaeota archaeon]|nr:hypothetical protein [Candidatus Woesearchaeota archaeon]
MNKTRYYGIVFFTIFLMLSLPITQAQFAPATENNVGSLQTIFNRNTGSDSGGIPQEIGDIQNMLDSAPSTWAGIPPVPHEAGIEAWADNALNKFPPRDYSANELRGFSRIASRLGDEYNMFNQAANLFNVNDEEMCVVPTDDAGLALMDPSGASVNTFTSEQGGRPSAGQAILPPDGTQDNRGAGGGAISMY